MRRTAWTAADGVGATEWLEMGGEKKPLVMSDLGCADGCRRQMGAKNYADGCGRRGCNGVAGNGWGKGKGRERMGKEGTGGERKGQEGKGRERMGKEGKGNGKEGKGRERKRKEGKGWERKGKEGKGRERSGADGCGRPGCKEVAGNGWGEEAAGDERPWLRGRLRTANGCEELRGWLRTAWVQRSGWKWVKKRERKGKDGKGRDRRGKEGTGRERKGKDRKGRKRERKGRERKGKEGKGWERKGKKGKGVERTAADGLGAKKSLEMGGEKKPLVMSDLGCADGCGRQMGARNCADGCGRRGCNGVAGNG